MHALPQKGAEQQRKHHWTMFSLLLWRPQLCYVVWTCASYNLHRSHIGLITVYTVHMINKRPCFYCKLNMVIKACEEESEK